MMMTDDCLHRIICFCIVMITDDYRAWLILLIKISMGLVAIEASMWSLHYRRGFY